MPVGTKNPQSGSASSSSSGTSPLRMKNKKALPPLFWYMEIGDWEKATDRAQRHPREVKTWTTLRTKSMADAKVSGTKRLALHHACFKLRSVVPNARTSTSEDSFVEVCKFIMLLISLYPEAAGVRESRHGCLPLHLAAFASCAPRGNDESLPTPTTPTNTTPVKSPSAGIPRPHAISQRTASEGTTGSAHTNMTEIFMQENYAASQTAHMDFSQKRDTSTSSVSPIQPSIGVSMNSTVLISAKREKMAVKVINALLDAYPKAIRVDSEGGRLPLHTACAGRATPRVITTLLTAYPAAARHRNKDGFLPLHLAAHWGVSHPNVAIALLKSYPDSTLGRNRWERTPLEEALCMAGENGRPHQAALVCALRKHPSYWTRTPDEVLRSEFVSERSDGPTSVDIDDSLPDDDTSFEGEEIHHGSAGHLKLTAEKSKEGSGFLVRLPPLKSRKPSDLALHHVLSLPTLIKNQNWNAVRDRVAHYPQEAGEQIQAMTRGGFMSTAGFTPLHYACERRPPVEVVEALITAWPDSVTARVQPGGALPLHVACTWHASDSVVRVLTHSEPAACRIPDDLGNIPLHCAAFSGADIHVLDILLRVYPKSALARNHQGSLAGDIIKRLRHDNRKIAMERVKAATDSVVTFQHQRNRSNGSCSAVAQRAMELNTLTENVKLTPDSQQILTDADEGADGELDGGIEVTYESDDKEELVWI